MSGTKRRMGSTRGFGALRVGRLATRLFVLLILLQALSPHDASRFVPWKPALSSNAVNRFLQPLGPAAAFAASAVCDVDGDGDVDLNDVNAIFAARGTSATGLDDPRDTDGDGLITINDGRACVLQCTLPRCAEPPTNAPPVADAGPDQTVRVGDTVTLDGSGSNDPDGDQLSLTWTITAEPPGSAAVLSDPNAVMPTFFANVAGEYRIQLVVNDGQVNSAPDEVVISTENSPPVADAGPAQTVLVGDTVQLDGSGSSDVDGDPLTFDWALTGRPAGSTAALSDPTAVMPTFVADAPGEYVAQLIVNDGTVDSAPDTVMITTGNSPPVADAGPDQTVLVGETVQLDGSGSSDVDGDPLTFDWALTGRPAGSSAALSDPTAVMPTFVADAPGEYVAQLIVNDGTVDSAPDTVMITTGNSPPVADAGPDQTVDPGATVQLDGSGSSDVDGDPLTFTWALLNVPAGSNAVLSDPTDVTPSFVADLPGVYLAQVIVNDGTVDSQPDTVAITARAQADLSLSKIDEADPVSPGDFIIYTLTVANAGPSDATNVVVTDTLPAGVTFVSTSGCAEDPDGVPTCSLGTIAAGDTASYTITVTVDAATSGTLTNQATVASDTADPDTANNTAIEDTVVTPLEADLSLTKLDDVDPIVAGDTLTYTVTVNNAGPSDAANVVVTDTLPAGVTFVSTSGCAEDPNGMPTCSLGTIAAGDTASYTVTVTVDATTSGALTNTATVASDTADPNASNNTSTEDTAVTAVNTITLTPANLNLFTLDTADLTATLNNPAGAGGQVIDLTSDNTSIATVPATVTVPEGSTTATFPVTAGSTAGSAIITASATDFTSDTSAVVVSDRTMSLTLEGPLVGAGRSIGGTVALAQPAPAGGLTVTLGSTNPAVATVTPTSVTIPAGGTQATFSVNGVAAGQATITADATGFAQASAAVTVTTSLISFGAVPPVAPGQTVSLPVSLNEAAPPGGVTVTFQSNDVSVVTITPSVFIPEGAFVPAANPQVTGVGIGTAQVTATAAGFAPDTRDVVVTLSMSFAPSTLAVFEGRTAGITLNLSAPAPPGGLAVNLSTDDPSTATVAPSVLTVGPGETSAQAIVSGVTVGNTTLRANTAGVSETTATITVNQAPAINFTGSPVGEDLQARRFVSLTVTPPAPTDITLTVADPTIAVLSADATTPGTGTLTFPGVPDATGRSVFVQGLQVGATTVTVTAPGYATRTATITVTPSGFAWQTGNFTTTTFSPDRGLDMRAFRLNPGTFTVVPFGHQPLRPGVAVDVAVTSSNPAVGTVTSPFTFAANQSRAIGSFSPQTAGATDISLVTPPGFDTPAPASRQTITATVTAPDVNAPANIVVGRDLQVRTSISLQAAPPSPVDVTVTSSSGAIATVTENGTAEGGTSVTLGGVSSTSGRTIFIQGRGLGSAIITVQAPGYNDAIINVTVNPSGFIILRPASITTTVGAPNSTITIRSSRLDPATFNRLQDQSVRGGLTVNVPVTSSNGAVGTITTSPVVFGPNDFQQQTQFDPQSAGTTDITVGTPAGFSTPANLQQILATVNP